MKYTDNNASKTHVYPSEGNPRTDTNALTVQIITGIYTFRTWILWVDWNRQMGCLPLWRSATSSPSFTIPCFCTWKPNEYITMMKMWSYETYIIWIFRFRKSSCQWNLALYGKNTGWIMDSIYSSPYGLTQFNKLLTSKKTIKIA